jgi:predicted GNAT superfamily acetyltransferase
MGITRMFWTFDPLVARNAHLNLERLGARVVEYVRDMYGENPMSRTDSVIGSDRFVVEWVLTGGRADGRAGGAADGRLGAPMIAHLTDPLVEAAAVRIAVPPDIQGLKQDDPAAALAWRAATRRAFQHYLSRGYAVTGFARGTTHAPPAYLLEAPP